MKTNIKFLMMGALMTGVISLAQADTVNHTEIQSSIQNIIKKQINKNLFTEKSEINIKLVEAKKVIKFDDESNKNLEKEEFDLSENDSRRVGQYCKINLSFDKVGNIPYLGHDNQLMNVTKFQNERQKDIARQFVALHEQSHCEFTTIENPVLLRNAEKTLVSASNYFLKDMEVMNIDWGSGGQQLNYVHTVNESYSDVSAMTLLIKEYGIDDVDLRYVLKAIEVQRHDNYLQKGAEEHNTHVAIKKLFTPENLAQIASLNDSKSLQNFSLTLANEGVQSLMTQRKDFTEQTFTKSNFAFSVMVNLVRLAKKETLPKEEQAQFQTSLWKEGIESGLTYEIAKDFLKQANLDNYNFDPKKNIEGKTNTDLVDFARAIMEDSVNEKVLETIYDKSKSTIDKFKEQMYKNHERNVVEFDSKATKDEIMKRVGTLRSQFINDTKITPGLSHSHSN